MEPGPMAVASRLNERADVLIWLVRRRPHALKRLDSLTP